MKKNNKQIIKKMIHKRIDGSFATRRNVEPQKKIVKNKNIDMPKTIINKSTLSKRDERENNRTSTSKVEEHGMFKDYGVFMKDKTSEYDAAFVIASKDRYEKTYRLIKQLTTQKTKYKYKVIIFNDGSSDSRYDKLGDEFDIVYLKKNISGGKGKYYTVVNDLWAKAREYNPQTLIQLDDDFILCEKFLDRIMDIYYEKKGISNNYMAFCFHKYSFNNTKSINEWWDNKDSFLVDGGMCLDRQFLEKFNYRLDDIERRIDKLSPSYVWVRIAERLKEFGMRVYRTEKSLVWHDGNDDSKLNTIVRKFNKMITKDFIDD